MAKTKGYQPSKRAGRKDAHIAFEEGHEFHGAEIDVWVSASLGFYLDIAGLSEALADGGGDGLVEKFGPLIRQFGDDCLKDWNILDANGKPVPANGDGLLAQDMEFIATLLGAWMKGIASVSAPLASASSDGSGSEEGASTSAQAGP